jgi:RNAse (barnase) inhibitor barstar
MRTIELDGNSFGNLDTFYDEIERKLCPGFEGFGRNLGAFNDVLRGGFGLFDYDEPISIVWIAPLRLGMIWDTMQPLSGSKIL